MPREVSVNLQKQLMNKSSHTELSPTFQSIL